MKLNHKVDTIQVLRGIAAMMVLLCHFDIYFDSIFPGTKEIFSNGVIGVDVFFIISGFVIYISYKGDNALEFFIKRFFRVYVPAAIAIVITVYIAGIKMLDNESFFKSIFFIPLENVNPPFYGYNLLAVVWTLVYEMYFYFLFTIAIIISRKTYSVGIYASLLILFSVFGGQYFLVGKINIDAMSYVYNGDINLLPKQIISLSGNPIILEFLLGIFSGYLFKRYRKFINPSKTTCNILIMICCLVFTVRYFGPNIKHGILDGGLYSYFLFIAFIIWHRGIELGLYNEPGRKSLYIGTISFSIYLIHVAVIIGFIEKYNYWLRHGGQLIAGLSVTLFASIAYYHIIEVNSQKAGKIMSSLLRSKIN
ncbi:acyltransferase [Salmonella enterica subsp. enterica]|nr:acyltransferase [Salmonella enterica subsp. enterica]EAX7038133.1 acyltransferase [Salmonella enterica]EDR7512945.1 acyltransferase [Salmonella enterica subsp. enterica serovar Michigan]EAX7058852.1 acyltransferase [Salmonella enterica]EAX8666679.1 acyltransferase [Salmonella enterica]